MIDQWRKFIAPLQRRILLMLARGVVQSVSAGGLQKIQMTGLADEVLDGLEHLEPYGFTSKPKAGAEALALFMGGNRDHGVVVMIADRRTRPQGLAAGDVALWTGSGGQVKLEDATKDLIAVIGKLKITNSSSKELITVLERLANAIVNARVVTALGPQPLLNAADPFSTIKTDIGSFKL